METHFYETFNKEHVRLVDLLTTPIERITEDGVKTSEEEVKFDILIYATGFSASKSFPFECCYCLQWFLIVPSYGFIRGNRLPRARWSSSQ